MNFRLKI